MVKSSSGARAVGRRTLAMLGASLLVAAGLTTGLLAAAPSSASAAIGSANFDAGDLISDTVFYDGFGTSQTQVQSVLNTEGASCVAAGTLACLKNITMSVPAEAASAYCNAIPASAKLNAAQIFVSIGKSCSINPAVLVVLVQKEQSLVTRSSPTVSSYQFATGYNCPDSTGCQGAGGFYTQVYHAAMIFQTYHAHPTSFNYQPFHNNTILYSPTRSCGTGQVYIENYATAGLYDYTPYQPNSAALSHLYGVGNSCSSYGNRNFWTYYNNWFGVTGNLLASSSFEGSTTGWGAGNGTINRQLVKSTTAQSGDYYLQSNTSVAGRSIAQIVKATPNAGTSFTASVWLRSSSADAVTGKVELATRGGTAESSSTAFSVTNTWTQVTTTISPTSSGHTGLELFVYLGVAGANLQIDTADLSRVAWQPGRGAAGVSSPSFEQGLGTWTFKNGFMNRSIVKVASQAEDGSQFLAANTTVTGRSVGQDIPRTPIRGETYTATVWMRSSSATLPFTGKLVLWGLGGSSENAVTPFTVGSTWTPVTVNLPITKTGHTRLRIEVYLGSLKYSLWLDNVSVNGNVVPNGSFETGVSNLVTSNGTATITQTATDPTVPGLVAGAKQAVFSVGAAGNSVAISQPRRLAAGDTYTASVWLRTVAPATTADVKLALWATGDSSQVVTNEVPALTNTWTQVTVVLHVSDAANSNLKLELYSGTPAVQIAMDGVQLY